MGFKYSASIENTPEARGWLRGIGYYLLVNNELDKYLFVFNDTLEVIGGNYVPPHKGMICCRGNIGLFKAITAITDEHDNNQWFVSKDNKFIMCWQSELKHVVDNYYEEYSVSDFHKATKEELIMHFGNKPCDKCNDVCFYHCTENGHVWPPKCVKEE